jgi:hypothetical protein
VTLQQVDRSLIVESRDGESSQAVGAIQPAPADEVAPEPAQEAAQESSQEISQEAALEAVPEPGPEPVQWPGAEPPQPAPAGGGIATLARLMAGARIQPRWPMYLRTLRQHFRSIDPAFDERRWGFGGIHDLLRQAQREGIFRVDRNRHGVIRIFAGDRYPLAGARPVPDDTVPGEGPADAADPDAPRELPSRTISEMFGDEPSQQPGVLEAEPPTDAMEGQDAGVEATDAGPVEETDAAGPAVAEKAPGEDEKPRRRARTSSKPVAPRKRAPARRPRSPRKAGRSHGEE